MDGAVEREPDIYYPGSSGGNSKERDFFYQPKRASATPAQRAGSQSVPRAVCRGAGMRGSADKKAQPAQRCNTVRTHSAWPQPTALTGPGLAVWAVEWNQVSGS